ncbi:MAG: sigma-70 family RNA polymerase sigma factor [Eubacteriaceae bacterium]|jgi:RNA polymerase sporulation-specific sigma factor|nr:sigma-70 family RNA polymerase sigma factor [Eubacteriaceae bacterium]
MSVQSESYEKYYSRELIEAAQAGDKQAMETLVKNNTPLVSSLIKKYTYLSESESYDDLFQIGAIGLIKAIKNFDFSYNTRFSTYAVYIINGELKRHFRDDGIIKVSRSIKSVYIKARAQSETYTKSHGVEPGIQSIADAIGETYEDVATALEACQRPEYLADYAAGSDHSEKSRRNEELIEDKKNAIEDAIDVLALKSAISTLSSDYRKIVMLRYVKNMTQSEVARSVGLSQVQVSRLEKKIIEALKKNML